jgi:predicted TIM-barrel fold metal-dependent hydrolase
MPSLDYQPFDCDNHYYEAEDSFSRHLDPLWAQRTFMWAEINQRRYHMIGGKLCKTVSNPTFDPIARPGAMYDFFRGNPERKQPWEFMQEREPIRAEYRNRDARLEIMDQQGLEACWMFPTLAMLYEEPLKHDPVAVTVLFKAFNRWLEEDWGFCYHNRIMAAPYIPMACPDFARDELQWALEKDARVVVVRAAAAFTLEGSTSPGNPVFDGFWGLANEAGITVVVHAGDSGVSSNGYIDPQFQMKHPPAEVGPSIKAVEFERAAHDFLLSLVFDKLFERFPRLRIASVENGAQFLPALLKTLATQANTFPQYFTEDPVELFKKHVWINPFWEDDVYSLESIMGADRILFGSDWPHIEGLPEPLDYVDELGKFDDTSKRMILRDNVRGLNIRI